jgi:hypothetical protein
VADPASVASQGECASVGDQQRKPKPERTNTVDHYQDLLQRLDSVEKDYEWSIRFIGYAVLGLGAILGISWLNLRLKVTSFLAGSHIRRARDSADKAIADISSKVIEINKFYDSIRETSEGMKVKIAAYDIDPALPRFAFEAGVVDLDFDTNNYRSGLVNFGRVFLSVPEIFVAECGAGEWAFAKVDEKSEIGFKWAARTLTGVPAKYKTTIQWFAVAKRPLANETSVPASDPLTIEFPTGRDRDGVHALVRALVRLNGEDTDQNLQATIKENYISTQGFIDFGAGQSIFSRTQVKGLPGVALTSIGRDYAIRQKLF